MNDGVKILLERMRTHPEEFYGDINRWSDVLTRFEKYFNASERALINGALTSIRREEFTGIVMQKLLAEPVTLNSETFTINTVGRDPWGNAHEEYENALMQSTEEQLAQIKEILRNRLQQATTKKSR